MSDTTITESYNLTLEAVEAYFDDDPRTEAIAWLALGDDAKIWYIKAAAKAINRLPLKGYRYWQDGNVLQVMEFPRVIDGVAYGWDTLTAAAVVPDEVRYAEAEEALAIYSINVTADKKERLALQRQGVISASYSGTSEQYAQNPSGAISGAGSRYKGLMSFEAYELMKGFIGGATTSRM